MSETILILGSSGYMGSAFVRECNVRGLDHYAAHVGEDCYADRSGFLNLIAQENPTLVINCSAYIPAPSVDACKDQPFETMEANVTVPAMLAEVCQSCLVPLAHLSTGCLFDERREYTEEDVPTRGWNGYCGYYVGCKLAAEQIVSKIPQHYILRLRLPFDNEDNPRNYLTKISKFEKIFVHMNSLTHRGDFVRAALDLWNLKAPFGTYHMTNPGFESSVEVACLLNRAGILNHKMNLVESPDTTGCKLSTKKLLDAGVNIRDVHEALEHSVKNWIKA